MIEATTDFEAHLELFETEIIASFNQFYELCKFYTEPENKLPYFKRISSNTLEYKDFLSGQKLSVHTTKFDCFQFVWFILKKLAEYRIIKSDLKYIQTIGTIVPYPLYSTVVLR